MLENGHNMHNICLKRYPQLLLRGSFEAKLEVYAWATYLRDLVKKQNNSSKTSSILGVLHVPTKMSERR